MISDKLFNLCEPQLLHLNNEDTTNRAVIIRINNKNMYVKYLTQYLKPSWHSTISFFPRNNLSEDYEAKLKEKMMD